MAPGSFTSPMKGFVLPRLKYSFDGSTCSIPLGLWDHAVVGGGVLRRQVRVRVREWRALPRWIQVIVGAPEAACAVHCIHLRMPTAQGVKHGSSAARARLCMNG